MRAFLLALGLLPGSSKILAASAYGREEQNNVETFVEAGVPTRKVKVYQHMLPEKNEWHISKGNKQICKGGPYSNWYSESPADCALSTGSYSITCCDTRAKEGWSGGYVLIHGENHKLCKNFAWGGLA